jgi:Na+/proline symporter
MNTQLLLLLASVYAALLFYVAWRAEAWRDLSRHWQAAVYSLSLAVYCSSWTFFGAVGSAVDEGWHFLAIYLGPILVFNVGWPFLHRLLVVCSRNKITSIADFIGSRYGKSQHLAAIVTIVAVLGSLPYIALQLKAVTLAWSTVNQNEIILFGDHASGTSFITALLMAWFAIIFGTRVIDGPRRHTGLVTALALESLVKLVAFAAVAFVALRLLAVNSDADWQLPASLSHAGSFDMQFITQLFLAMVATVCLPRQFHVMAVEHHSSRDVKVARWVFPIS